VTYRDLTGRLRMFGCYFARQARGSHEIWQRETTGALTTIPNQGNKDLAPGTISKILRDLDISPAAFRAAGLKGP